MQKCKHCYGKGYSTEFSGGVVGKADFPFDKEKMFKGQGTVVRLCKCERGKNLDKFFRIRKKYKSMF